MRCVSIVLLALVLGACGAAAVEASSAPSALRPARLPAPAATLFPERPTLDAIAPARLASFKQETWTELAPTRVQHCHEWGFPRSEESALREHAQAVLERLGIHTHFGGMLREDGIVLAVGDVGSDGTSGEPMIKLVACTEGESDVAVAELRQHFARITTEARSATAARALGLAPDVAWERQHASGRRQIGMRARDLDPGVARSALARAGFAEATGTRGAIDLTRGPERVRFLGDRVWWQSDVAPRPAR
ncbi:MAG: hypothetical protein M3Y87_09565 [Myxococcota bacterium]|nr:hypothetical protein [Myxococcota bacterium]